MFAYHEILRHPKSLKCLSKYASRSTFFLEIFHTMLQWICTVLLSTASWIAIVCFILLLHLQCNFVIVEATYIVYCFGGCFFFAGSLVAACCCLVQLCKVGVLHLQLDLFFFFLLYGVEVLHPQFDLRFFRSSFQSKFPCHNFTFYSFFVVQCLQFACKNVCLFLLACSSYVSSSFGASAVVW